MDLIDKPGEMEAAGGSPAQQALARLVADQSRPSGVTAWCDEHRPDVELVIRELGGPALAKAVGMVPSTLSSWAARECDAIICVLETPYIYKGLWVEMGVALALDKPVYVVGNAGDSCIFMNHPLVKKLGTWEEAKGNFIP